MRTGADTFSGLLPGGTGCCAITGDESVAKVFQVAVLGMCLRTVFSSVFCVSFFGVLF